VIVGDADEVNAVPVPLTATYAATTKEYVAVVTRLLYVVLVVVTNGRATVVTTFWLVCVTVTI
jgi:hypothetical protein